MTNNTAGTILVAIDGSRNSMLAAGLGARMAKLMGAHLGLIHVLDVPTLNFWVGVEARMKEDIRAQAEATLTDISEKITASCGIVPEYYIVEGLPEMEIQKVVNNDPSILMVVSGRFGVATEKHTRLTVRRTMGRLTEKLSTLLPVPVLVVPDDIPVSHICAAMADLRPQPENPQE